MKITSVDLSAELYNDGLETLAMDRLKETVIIAGKNGAGKTRLLRRIASASIWHLTPQQLADNRNSINNYKAYLANTTGTISDKQKEQFNNDIKNIELAIKSHKQISLDTKIEEQFSALYFVPKKLEYKNPETIAIHQIKALYEKCLQLGMEHIAENAYVYIQYAYIRYSNANNKNLPLIETELEKNNTINSFNKLNKLINQFLHTKISGTMDGQVALFGLPLGKANLSEGQKVLLQLCVAIHAQGHSLEKLILLLDEPENHLHPEALIQFLNLLKNTLKDGQLWISTHSIHALSWADSSCIWYLNEGQVSYSGKNPEIVLKGLLGGENEVENLQDFINLPAQLASIQFAYECLTHPHVADATSPDPQNNQIIKILESTWSSKEKKKVRILDWGAGKGRLAEAFSNLSPKYRRKLDYFAYDLSVENEGPCKDAISALHGSPFERFHSTQNSLLEHINEQSVDFVVMCNVLHEIPPDQWSKIFSSKSTICKLIKKNGYLLIVEDSLLPIGEKPHKDGFFILGMGELQTLFCATPEHGKILKLDANGKGRLFAYLIPASCIKNVTDATMRKTLEKLRAHAKEEIQSLRKECDRHSGKLLAFWTQQLANVILYLE